MPYSMDMCIWVRWDSKSLKLFTTQDSESCDVNNSQDLFLACEARMGWDSLNILRSSYGRVVIGFSIFFPFLMVKETKETVDICMHGEKCGPIRSVDVWTCGPLSHGRELYGHKMKKIPLLLENADFSKSK